VFQISILGLGALFGGAKSTKVPVATGMITSKRLFRNLYYQTMPGGT